MSLDDDGFLVKVHAKILKITVFQWRIEYASNMRETLRV